MFKMIKKAVTALGGLMLPLSIAVFMQRDVRWFSSHSGVSYAIYVITALVCVWTCWLWFGGHLKRANAAPPVHIVNSPNISPTISPNFSQILNVYPNSANPTQAIDEDRDGRPEIGPFPNLVALDVNNCRDEKRSIPGTTNTDLICLLPIESRIPDEHEAKTLYVENVCASIRFRGDNDLVGSVSRAPWYGITENEVSFPISSVRSVVIGRRIEGRWVFYQNPNQFKGQYRQGSTRTIRATEISSLPLGGGPLEATVIVFNRRTGDVYLKQRISIYIVSGELLCTVRIL